MDTQSITLQYSDIATGKGSSHKEYRIHVCKQGSGYTVDFAFGRIGETLQSGTKTPTPVTLEEATSIFERLKNEKLHKGYVPTNGQAAAAPIAPVQSKTRTPFMPELLEEITQEQVNFYLDSDLYWLEVKADGHRRQVQKIGPGKYVGYNKKGEPVALPAPLVSDLELIRADTFFLDGELIGDDLVIYDLLELNGRAISELPYKDRSELRNKLRPDYRRTHLSIVSTWKTKREKKIGFLLLKRCRAEGFVAKRIDAPYKAGRNGQHRKHKFIKSCTCKVIRIGDKGHDSATLALLDKGKWREVGRASMIGKDKRIQVGSLVECQFLYFTGNRLYQARLVAFRNDQTESDCTFAQLRTAFKQGVEA